ncbi:MAG: hypothetical protein FWG71_10415, partial [Synergistaceae bacterium]|nr:hypothetical protein [Synergistaceae bacterium]
TRFLQMQDWTGPNKGPDPVYDKTFTVVGGIPFHQQGKNNWIWVEHTFTDEIKRLPQGEYRLFIELDPYNQIEETHEKWDYRVENLDPGTSSVEPYAYNPGGDPGGNNIGYVKVALYNYFDEAEAASANRTADAEPAAGLRVNIADNGLRPLLTGMAVRRGLAGGVTIPYDLEVWYDDPNAPDFVPGFRVAVTIVPDEGGGERMIAYGALPGLTKDRRYQIRAKLDDDAFRYIEEAGRGEIKARVIGSHDFELQMPEPVRFSYDGAIEVTEDGDKIGINVQLTEYPELSPETIMSALAAGEEIPFEAEIWYDDEDAPDSIPGFRVIVYVEPETGGQFVIAERETGELTKGTRYRYDGQLTGNFISNLIAAEKGTIKWQIADSEYEVTLLIPEEIPFDMNAAGLGCGTGSFAAPGLLILLAAMAIRRKKLRIESGELRK